jgi:hypothetical protein
METSNLKGRTTYYFCFWRSSTSFWQNNGFNVYRFGTEANLVWPRIVAAPEIQSASGFVPKTKAGYNFNKTIKTLTLKPKRIVWLLLKEMNQGTLA